MIQSFINSQRSVATAAAFILTYFVVLSLGRFFKRRARVPLGFFFQVFCLTLPFYAAITVYGVQSDWRNHIGAALVLLSPAVIVAFGSSVIAIILGIAGQNLLGAIIAGIQLQISRPYKVGDWLQVNERFAEVMEINWRSTRLRTNDGIYLDIPNNEIVRQTIVNLHYPTQVHAMRIRVGVEYKNRPNRVKDALFRATSSADGVLAEPKVRIFLVDFADFAVIYEIKFYMGNHSRINEINDAV